MLKKTNCSMTNPNPNSKIITIVDNDGTCGESCFFWDPLKQECKLRLVKNPYPPCEEGGSGKYKLTWEKVDETTEQVIDNADTD